MPDIEHDSEAEILERSDEDEWEDVPVAIGRRPTGNKVVSARLPAHLVNQVFEAAEQQGIRPSEVVRLALERYFRGQTFPGVVVTQAGQRVQVFHAHRYYETENPLLTESTAQSTPPDLVSLSS